MALADQYNLSTNQPFLQRVQAALVHNALQVQSEAVNDVQTISLTGNPTGGTFTLTYGGQTTAAINWNASAGAVQLALQNLSSIGAGNVAITGGPGPGTAWIATFVATLGNSAHALMTLGTNSLTGGSSPNVSLVHTTTGASVALHVQRQALASKILANPIGYASLMAVGVADSATVQTDFPGPSYAQSGSVTTAQADTDLDNQVSAIFNAYT